ncbi:unnamed protein product [Rhizophagus irregularis]|nr:unnamed protein product [Rhizophagus irregularis]
MKIEKNLIIWLNNQIGNPINITLDLMFDKEEAPQVDGYLVGVFICMFARLNSRRILNGQNQKILLKFEEAAKKFRKVVYRAMELCSINWTKFLVYKI